MNEMAHVMKQEDIVGVIDYSVLRPDATSSEKT